MKRSVFLATGSALLGAAAMPGCSLAQHAMGMLGGEGFELRSKTTLPMRFYANHVYLPAEVGKAKYAIIFDSAALTGVILPDARRALALPSAGSIALKGAGGVATPGDVVRIPSLSIGGVHLSNVAFVELQLSFDSPYPGVPLLGILGRAVLSQAVTTIDYEHNTVTFEPPDQFSPDPSATAIAISSRMGIPNVVAIVDGKPGNFDIDVGSSGSVVLNTPFAASSGLATSLAPSVPTIVGYGAGGPIFANAARAKTVRIGSFEIPNAIASISTMTEGVFAESSYSGNIGCVILERFTVTIDMPHDKLYLKPNSRFNAPFAFNRSGMYVHEVNDTLEVMSVTDRGPAAQAGVLKGDVLTSIDGVGARSINREALANIWLKPPGTHIALGIQRGSHALHTELVLRDLI